MVLDNFESGEVTSRLVKKYRVVEAKKEGFDIHYVRNPRKI